MKNLFSTLGKLFSHVDDVIVAAAPAEQEISKLNPAAGLIFEAVLACAQQFHKTGLPGNTIFESRELTDQVNAKLKADGYTQTIDSATVGQMRIAMNGLLTTAAAVDAIAASVEKTFPLPLPRPEVTRSLPFDSPIAPAEPAAPGDTANEAPPAATSGRGGKNKTAAESTVKTQDGEVPLVKSPE